MKGVVSYDIEVLAANHCLALVYGGDGTMVAMELWRRWNYGGDGTSTYFDSTPIVSNLYQLQTTGLDSDLNHGGSSIKTA